jgi:ribosomal protein S18 acetylase RimI-like enzyme
MGRKVELRLAERGDEALVVSLIAGFRDFNGATEPRDGRIAQVVAELIDDDRTEFLLAGDPPVGFAQLRFRLSVWTGAEDAWLEDLFVVEDARRAGTGRALVEGCVGRARARGCKRLQLDVNESNQAALSLYESLGFSTSTPQRFSAGRNLYLTLRV